MGADIYHRRVHEKVYVANEGKFDKAVAKRNAILDKIRDNHKLLEDEKAQLINEAMETEEYKKAQEEVSKYYSKMYSKGYFRDSYNDSSLLWKLGLSWWAWAEKYANDDSKVEPENLKKILVELEENKDKLEYIEDKRDYEYFTNKYKDLVELINEAIKAGDPLDFSV